jgi:S-adenosyl methyltransferase
MSPAQGTGTDPELAEDSNPNVAHPARVYDYWLGGNDN